jgi:hypothetical protein
VARVSRGCSSLFLFPPPSLLLVSALGGFEMLIIVSIDLHRLACGPVGVPNRDEWRWSVGCDFMYLERVACHFDFPRKCDSMCLLHAFLSGAEGSMISRHLRYYDHCCHPMQVWSLSLARSVADSIAPTKDFGPALASIGDTWLPPKRKHKP